MRTAKSLIVAMLNRQVFKTNVTTSFFPHSFPPSSAFSRSRSFSSVFFNPKIPLSASLSTATTMGETPVAVDAGMDAVQRRLMFDDESVSPSFSISLNIPSMCFSVISLTLCCFVYWGSMCFVFCVLYFENCTEYDEEKNRILRFLN